MAETKAVMVALDKDGDGKIGMGGECVRACVRGAKGQQQMRVSGVQPGAVHSSVLKCLTGAHTKLSHRLQPNKDHSHQGECHCPVILLEGKPPLIPDRVPPPQSSATS